MKTAAMVETLSSLAGDLSKRGALERRTIEFLSVLETSIKDDRLARWASMLLKDWQEETK